MKAEVMEEADMKEKEPHPGIMLIAGWAALLLLAPFASGLHIFIENWRVFPVWVNILTIPMFLAGGLVILFFLFTGAVGLYEMMKR